MSSVGIQMKSVDPPYSNKLKCPTWLKYGTGIIYQGCKIGQQSFISQKMFYCGWVPSSRISVDFHRVVGYIWFFLLQQGLFSTAVKLLGNTPPSALNSAPPHACATSRPQTLIRVIKSMADTEVLNIWLFLNRELWREWNGRFQRASCPGRPLHCTLWQNLQQCRREELWSAPAQAPGAASQGQSCGLLLRGHDSAGTPECHATPGCRGRVLTHWKVNLNLFLFPSPPPFLLK